MTLACTSKDYLNYRFGFNFLNHATRLLSLLTRTKNGLLIKIFDFDFFLPLFSPLVLCRSTLKPIWSKVLLATFQSNCKFLRTTCTSILQASQYCDILLENKRPVINYLIHKLSGNITEIF